ncbi:MAG: bifunctional folylpolyglutamate synthase/dihydrofolate synthase [Candidatus Nanopelagicales bacterium]
MAEADGESSGALVPSDYASLEAQLLGRWPENAIEPSLDRIAAIMDLMGAPQGAYPVIQVTGTNGKSSTARMIASLLRAFGLRTGLFTSPHLVDVRERIEIDGVPIDADTFLRVARDTAPYIAAVDARAEDQGGTPVTFFETLTAMAYAAFADAPVDVAVIEVGMGGTWDATSVCVPQVAVLTRVDLDHTEILGDTVEAIAEEKAGIIREGCFAVSARQAEGAAAVLRARASEMQASLAWEGDNFWVIDRTVAVGGQLLDLQGLSGTYEEVFIPLFGRFQADNAAVALAVVEAFLGGGAFALDIDAVRQGFADVESPGRLEVVRRGPTVIVDAAHNPAGASALADALSEAFAFTHLVGVIAVLGEKDARGILLALEPVLDEIVVTQNSSPRRLPVDDLAALAQEIFGEDRVEVCPRFDDALDAGIRLAEEADTYAASGVIVTGSVVTAGQARALLRRS